MIIGLRSGTPVSRRSSHVLAISALALALPAFIGCSNAARPLIGPIQFTTNSGAPGPAVNSLAVNGQVYLVATVTNDDQFLGVSWTITCGSAQSPGSGSIDTSCGSCVPSQTQSGPVPHYPSTGFITTYNAPPEVPKGSIVTITAHATSLPSVTSSITLKIVPTETASLAMPSLPGAVTAGNEDVAMSALMRRDNENAKRTLKEER